MSDRIMILWDSALPWVLVGVAAWTAGMLGYVLHTTPALPNIVRAVLLLCAVVMIPVWGAALVAAGWHTGRYWKRVVTEGTA